MDRDGDRIEATASVGDTLLDVAIKNDVELEGTGLSCAQNLIVINAHYFILTQF